MGSGKVFSYRSTGERQPLSIEVGPLRAIVGGSKMFSDLTLW